MTDNPSKIPLPAFKAGLEAVEIEHEGKPMILLRDQEGLIGDPVVITTGAFFLAMLLDGKNDMAELQHRYTEVTGALLTVHDVQNLLAQFEKMQLLETPALIEKRRTTWENYMAGSSRPAHFQGKGYPKEPLEIAVKFGKYFKDPLGPGKELAAPPSQKKPLAGLICPHIDFDRGGPLYASAYQVLSERPKPDVVVAIGVAHASPNSPWVFTKKSYETPYGPLSVDESLYGELAGSLWYDPAADEAVHRLEHSLEFQAVWLKYLYRDEAPAWVPILCSSFDRFCPDKPPSTVHTVESAIVAMGQAIKRQMLKGKNVLILAGVDLSHVGPRFGDEKELNPPLREKIETDDRASLELFFKGEMDEFYLSVVKEDHWRKWCGLSALYTAGRLMKIVADEKLPSGKLLSYHQADDVLGGVVSFCSGFFPRDAGDQ